VDLVKVVEIIYFLEEVVDIMEEVFLKVEVV